MKNKLKKLVRVATMAWLTIAFASLCIYEPTFVQTVLVILNLAAAAYAASRIQTEETDKA